MNIEEKIYELLSEAASVTALCPADRIKVRGDWQGLTRPYIVHAPTGVEPTETHEGRVALTKWPRYQVSCFANSSSAARALADAVRAVFEASAHPRFFWADLNTFYDSETRVAHIAQDFDIWEGDL